MARGFLRYKAEVSAVLPSRRLRRRPFVSQCPTAVGRPSFEAGTSDPRGLIEGLTDRKSTRSIAVRKPRGSGVARQRWGASLVKRRMAFLASA